MNPGGTSVLNTQVAYPIPALGTAWNNVRPYPELFRCFSLWGPGSIYQNLTDPVVAEEEKEDEE